MIEPKHRPVVNASDIEELSRGKGDHWGASFKSLTPSMAPRGGRLGVNQMRIPPKHVGVPFHAHQREDEVFYVLSGRGVVRYGDDLYPLRPGDCVSCPAGTGVAHQIANPYDEDLVYLAVGPRDPDEVCVYPDTGKVLVRSLGRVGWLENVDYMEGEPDRPKVLDLAEEQGTPE